MPHDLIAEKENVSQDTINKRMTKARTQLTQILTQEYEQEMYKHLMEGKPDDFEDRNKYEQQFIESIINDELPEFEITAKAFRNKLKKKAREELKTQEKAEDVTQKALFRIFKRYHTLDPTKSWRQLGSYILKAAENLSKNEKRNEARNPVDSVNYLIEEEFEQGHIREIDFIAGPERSTQPLANHIVEDDRLKQAVEESLQELKPHHRTVLELRELEGKSYKEISEITGVKSGTIKSRLNRARTNMQENLLEYPIVRETLAEKTNGSN